MLDNIRVYVHGMIVPGVHRHTTYFELGANDPKNVLHMMKALADIPRLSPIPKETGWSNIYLDIVNHHQQNHIARTICLKFENMSDSVRDVIQSLAHKPLNKKKQNQAIQKIGTQLTTALFYGFYNQRRHASYWMNYRVMIRSIFSYENTKLFADYLSLLYYDAIGFGNILEGKFRTSTVMQLLMHIRQTEDFGLMPILADALEDADWREEKLLIHLRTSQVFSLGSWIFRAAGIP